MAARPVDRRKEDETAENDKFPVVQVTVLAICKFSEPIAFTSVIAYTFLMAQWLHGGDPTNASFYAGLLVSVYAFGEVLTSMFWGAVSDRVGRKPIVLSGLCGVAVSCIMFGFAKRYWVALLARLLGGMLNGNVSVMQTMLAEQVKRPEHEPTAYATHPFVWVAGGIIGSAMGGFLSQPAKFYPDVFPPDGLFGEYPFLLPNLVSVGAIAIAVLQGAIFLKETNPLVLERRANAAAANSFAQRPKQNMDETTPLRHANRKDATVLYEEESETSATSSASSGSRKDSLVLEEAGLPDVTDPHLDLRRNSFGTIHSIRSKLRDGGQPVASELVKPTLKFTFNYDVCMLITSFVVMSYHCMAAGNLLPIYLLDAPRQDGHHPSVDLRGGLGYDVHDVGSFLAANGLIAMLVQILVFPPFIRRMGVWRSYIVMMMFYPLSYSLIPLLTMLPPGSTRSAGVYTIMIIQNHLNIIIPPCVLILIKNATPSPGVLGTVNGACMGLTCLARTAAPPLEGIIYSVGGSATAWFSLAGVAVLAIVQLYWVPRQKTEVVVEGVITAQEDQEADESRLGAGQH